MNILKKYFYPAIAFIILLTVLSYKLFYSFNFHPDFARDIYDILVILQGKLTLIGPKLSFGGIYSGPYYYYLLAPVFFLTRLDLNSLLVLNMLLFVSGTVFLYLIVSKKAGSLFALTLSLLLAYLPVYVIGARGPWNGSTYLPFLLIYLAMIFYFKPDGRKIFLVFLGFFGGMIINIHLVSAPVVLVGLIYLLLTLKRKNQMFFFLGGVLIAFIPLLLFEIKHDFVMTKNTFLVGSYKTFVENNNIPNAVSGKKNFFENLSFLSGRLSGQLGINILFYWGVSVFLFFRTKYRERFLIISSFALVFLFSAILRYQFGSHYLYPVSLFLAFSLGSVLLNSKYRWLLFVFLILEIIAFPINIYNRSERVAETYERRVNEVIRLNLIEKSESFNIIQISKDYATYIPVGHEYRFFFRKNNFIPKTEFEYNQSETLLIFSELTDFDIEKLDNWEIKEFGRENIDNHKKYNIAGSVVHVLKKQ